MRNKILGNGGKRHHRILHRLPILVHSLLMVPCITFTTTGQDITGRIIDGDSLPIQGAVVRLTAMNLQCATDTNGAFSLGDAGVVHPFIPVAATSADNSLYRKWYTLNGRSLASVPAVWRKTFMHLSGGSYAPQMAICAPAGSSDRKVRAASAIQPPSIDTLFITHDSHLFRKLVVRVEAGTLAPIVMKDTSAVFSWSWEMLEEYFLDRRKLTGDPFGFSSPGELFASVNDPYTVYFSSDSAKHFVEHLRAETVGLGIRVDSVAQGYSVRDVFANSPAENAGIRPGDTIVKVSGRPAAGVSRSEFAGFITGKTGDSIKIAVSTGNGIKVVAAVLEYCSFPSVFTDSLNGTTAIITITGFLSETIRPGGTEEEFFGALEQCSWAGNIVLDLRANTGGFLEQALSCASYVVPPGQPLIRWTECVISGSTGASRVKDSVFTSTPKTKRFVKNLAILADARTASAAEVFIAMLRTALPGVKLIGSRTYGKATGQILLWGPDSALCRITCMRFSPLSGPSYDMVGIQPDLSVPAGEDVVEVAVQTLTNAAAKRRIGATARSYTDAYNHGVALPTSFPGMVLRLERMDGFFIR